MGPFVESVPDFKLKVQATACTGLLRRMCEPCQLCLLSAPGGSATHFLPSDVASQSPKVWSEGCAGDTGRERERGRQLQKPMGEGSRGSLIPVSTYTGRGRAPACPHPQSECSSLGIRALRNCEHSSILEPPGKIAGPQSYIEGRPSSKLWKICPALHQLLTEWLTRPKGTVQEAEDPGLSGFFCLQPLSPTPSPQSA